MPGAVYGFESPDDGLRIGRAVSWVEQYGNTLQGAADGKRAVPQSTVSICRVTGDVNADGEYPCDVEYWDAQASIWRAATAARVRRRDGAAMASGDAPLAYHGGLSKDGTAGLFIVGAMDSATPIVTVKVTNATAVSGHPYLFEAQFTRLIAADTWVDDGMAGDVRLRCVEPTKVKLNARYEATALGFDLDGKPAYLARTPAGEFTAVDGIECATWATALGTPDGDGNKAGGVFLKAKLWLGDRASDVLIQVPTICVEVPLVGSIYCDSDGFTYGPTMKIMAIDCACLLEPPPPPPPPPPGPPVSPPVPPVPLP